MKCLLDYNPHEYLHIITGWWFGYGRQVWGSILRATGFPGGFDVWWKGCQYRTATAPNVLPLSPPPFLIAQGVLDTLLLAHRELEKQLPNLPDMLSCVVQLTLM